ncbi:MAG TPA: ABC transporter permease [Burkholderiaceae bacterium]|jgi:ABC-2 type transport system permease protein|nr:ABC transporter permease [Burkholderiaceae bacterium]
MSGFSTLFRKEILRFWKVVYQTVAGPVISTVLYLLVFSNALQGRVEAFPGVAYTTFLVPGLVMMAMQQNSFANASSSLIQSKVTGNVVFILLPPLSVRDLFGAYVGAAMVRGLAVGLGVLAVTLFFSIPRFVAPLWALAFGLLGCAILGTMGLLAGIWAEKFDQMAAVQSFVIAPATFLAGVFYSVHSLPPFWQAVSHLNPFFYIVDGFRYGFVGVSDVPPLVSLAVVCATLAAVSTVALSMLKTGYKLRH